jgi:drug/metabolite transporter (DMT)-like permease
MVHARSFFLLLPNYAFIVQSKQTEVLPSTSHSNTLLILRGVLSIGVQCFYYKGLSLLPLSEGVVLFFTNPVFTTILAAVFLGEPFLKKDIISCLTCLVGVILVIKPPFLFPPAEGSVPTIENENLLLGATCVLTAAFGRALVQIIIRNLSRGVSALAITLHYAVIATALTPFLIILSGVTGTYNAENTMGTMVLGMFGFFTQFCMAEALTLGKAATVSIIGYIQIVFAFLMDIIFLGNVPSLTSTIGSGLISCTLFINLYQALKKK